MAKGDQVPREFVGSTNIVEVDCRDRLLVALSDNIVAQRDPGNVARRQLFQQCFGVRTCCNNT